MTRPTLLASPSAGLALQSGRRPNPITEETSHAGTAERQLKYYRSGLPSISWSQPTPPASNYPAF